MPDVGPVVAAAIREFFDEERNQTVISSLRANGVAWPELRSERSVHQSFAGKTFVLTGTLPSMSRADATAAIRNAGGKVTSSVTKKTDFLLAGDESGSKMDVARKLGVRVISEAELERMLDAAP